MTFRAVVGIVIFCMTIEAQEYFEAMGYTQVFTLTAGTKARPAAVTALPRSTGHTTAHLVVSMRRGVSIGVSGAPAGSKVSIYTITGKRLAMFTINNMTMFPVSEMFPGGVYIARLEKDRQALCTLRFRIVR